jgi:hypothetical protein
MTEAVGRDGATPHTLNVNQVVAYNVARARRDRGWTQVETSERLAPFLGYRLHQAGVSAIERTYDSERRRNIDVADVVAFARCFDLPIGWFFLPPPGRGDDLLEPGTEAAGDPFPVGELVALTLGTAPGWAQYLSRLCDLLQTDQTTVSAAVARHSTAADAVVRQMAEQLVRIVQLSPACTSDAGLGSRASL